MTSKQNFRINNWRGLGCNLLHKVGQMMAIFITCFVIYALTISGHHYSIDGVVMFQYAKALLFDHSFVMNPPVRWGIDFKVGQWPIGLSLFYMPILGILSQTIFRGDDSIKKIPYNPNLTHNPHLLENRPYLFNSFLNPIITASSAVILYSLCLELGFSQKKAAAAALVFALASPAAAYAKFDFAQPLASLFLLLMFLFLIRARKNGYGNLVLAGTSLGVAILARAELIVLTPVLLVAVFFLRRQTDIKQQQSITHKFKNLLYFSLPVIVFFLINQYINHLRFGSWFSTGYNPVTDFSVNPIRIMTALVGNLFSPGRGIFLFFPLSILSCIGLWKLFQNDRWLAWVFTGFIFGSLFFYSTWKDWGAGISWGPRFFIPLFPYLTLLAFLGFDLLVKYPRFIHATLFGILLFVGGIIALKGLLFNFLGFYGVFEIPQKVIDQGDYNFLSVYSPVLRGWENFAILGNYDIYWLQIKKIQESNGWTLIMPFICLIAIGYLVKFWYDYFLTRKSISSID